MIKNSYINKMTYDISEEEMVVANQLINYIDYSDKLLEDAKEFLNTIKVPFENNQQMETKEILSQRHYLREFRDSAIKKFLEFKTSAFYCVNTLTRFSSDPQISSMLKAFVNTVSDLEKSYDKFKSLFANMESATFVKDMIDNCKLLQAQYVDLQNILEERIKNYISSNILGETWVNKMYKDLKVNQPSKTPKTLSIIKNVNK